MSNWIKIGTDIERKPEVIRISRAMRIETPHAVGLLVRFWSWADEQTANGRIDGLTTDDLDTALRTPGLGMALVDVGWLLADDEGLIVPHFDRHMGQSAKRRAMDASRKVALRRESR
jgi:hypothetical protein